VRGLRYQTADKTPLRRGFCLAMGPRPSFTLPGKNLCGSALRGGYPIATQYLLGQPAGAGFDQSHHDRHAYGAASSAGPQCSVQVERSAHQCKVREGLREVSQGLAPITSLFRVEANMVGKPQHAFENQSCFLEPRPIVATGSGKRLDRPKCANVKSAFLPG
jgi:hypothetical protein